MMSTKLYANLKIFTSFFPLSSCTHRRSRSLSLCLGVNGEQTRDSIVAAVHRFHALLAYMLDIMKKKSETLCLRACIDRWVKNPTHAKSTGPNAAGSQFFRLLPDKDSTAMNITAILMNRRRHKCLVGPQTVSFKVDNSNMGEEAEPVSAAFKV